MIHDSFKPLDVTPPFETLHASHTPYGLGHIVDTRSHFISSVWFYFLFPPCNACEAFSAASKSSASTAFFLLVFFCFNFTFNSMNIRYWMLCCYELPLHRQGHQPYSQATLKNILNRIIYCCFQNFIWQDDIVVLLIEITNSLKNFICILC